MGHRQRIAERIRNRQRHIVRTRLRELHVNDLGARLEPERIAQIAPLNGVAETVRVRTSIDGPSPEVLVETPRPSGLESRERSVRKRDALELTNRRNRIHRKARQRRRAHEEGALRVHCSQVGARILRFDGDDVGSGCRIGVFTRFVVGVTQLIRDGRKIRIDVMLFR